MKKLNFNLSRNLKNFILTAVILIVAIFSFASCAKGKENYIVTFTVDENLYHSETVKNGGFVSSPSDPTKDNYSFAGWYDVGGKMNFNDTKIEKDITLVAKWEKPTEGIVYKYDEVKTAYTVADYTGSDDNVYIPSSIDGVPVTAIADEAFAETNIKSVVIPQTVEAIGVKAFYNCYLLSDVYICGDKDSEMNAETEENEARTNGGVVLLSSAKDKDHHKGHDGKNFGDDAFSGCESIKDLHISNTAEWCHTTFDSSSSNPLSNSSNFYINGLKSRELIIPEGVTKISKNAFVFNNFVKIVIPDSVTVIEDGAFAMSKNLLSLTIGKGVTLIGGQAFWACDIYEVYNFSSIEPYYGEHIPLYPGENGILLGAPDGDLGFNARRIMTSADEPSYLSTDMDGFIFYDDGTVCELVGYIGREKDVILPEGFNGKSYVLTKKSFSESLDIRSVVVSEGVTKIEGAFFRCLNLVCVTLPSTLTEIRNETFSGCSSLSYILDKSALITNRQEYLINVNCNIYKAQDNVSLVYQDEFIFIDENGKYILISYSGTDSSLILPESCNGNEYTVQNLRSNFISQFTPLPSGELLAKYQWQKDRITSVTIPKSVTIGNCAFEYYNNLETVVFEDGYKATSIGVNAFHGCEKLTEITLPDSITEICGLAFSGVTNLTAITLSDELIAIGYKAFEDCVSLYTISIPEKVTKIDMDAFAGCYRLVDVENKSSIEISEYSTLGKYALNIYNGENAGKFHQKGDFVFYENGTDFYLIDYKGNEKNITLPTDINGYSYAINDYAFSSLDIESVTMLGGVTSIGEGAFSYCHWLKSITLSEGITEIGKSAFFRSERLDCDMPLPESVTKIYCSAFIYWPSRNIELPDFNLWKISGNPDVDFSEYTPENISQIICKFFDTNTYIYKSAE